MQLQPGQAWFTRHVGLGKTNPYGGVYLAFAYDKSSDERWVIASDEPTGVQTFAQYRLRFTVEESFLDLKSNGFQLEASRLRDKHSLSQLCGVIALTILFLILQGVQVVELGNRRRVDPHWHRGMSYLKLGWNWIRLCLTQHWQIQVCLLLPSARDPQPSMASLKQHQQSKKLEFTVLSDLPAS